MSYKKRKEKEKNFRRKFEWRINKNFKKINSNFKKKRKRKFKSSEKVLSDRISYPTIFRAHPCPCTVGSYALVSIVPVCLSVTGPKFMQITQKIESICNQWCIILIIWTSHACLSLGVWVSCKILSKLLILELVIKPALINAQQVLLKHVYRAGVS